MPYVFSYVRYPLNKTNEVAKTYVESIKDYRTQLKPLAKEVVPNALKVSMDGIEATNVLEVKEGKLDEFLLFHGKIMMNYHDIEGFQYTSEVRATITEALGLIGMKPPD